MLYWSLVVAAPPVSCLVLSRQDKSVLSIGVTSSLSQHLRCGPFLCLVSLCHLFSSAPVYSPSSLPCVHGHWLGWRFVGGRMQEDRHGGGARAVSRGADVVSGG